MSPQLERETGPPREAWHRRLRPGFTRIPKKPGESPPEDALGGLKAVAEVSAIFVALAFVTGWSYMASYYMLFGLNPIELDFSVPAIASFAIHVIRHSGWPLPVAAILLSLLALLYPRLGAARRAWAGGCVAILLFTFATVGALRGRSAAAADMFDTSNDLPNVGFVSKTKSVQPDCLGEGTTDCKLLLHARSTYYFFEPISAAASSSVHDRSLNVYMAPDSEIVAVHLERGIE
ncbi:MAG TPA: hypothetical protein VH640_14945 [Bryobacteraceae bacterium]|jgi:hypothetical protein